MTINEPVQQPPILNSFWRRVPHIFRGDTGARGAPGPQGPRGDNGVQGLAGAPGLCGECLVESKGQLTQNVKSALTVYNGYSLCYDHLTQYRDFA